jgi:hypothetical protein
MLKSSDFTEIRRRIESAPFQCIRLVNEQGEKIISRANNSKPDAFLDKVENVLKEFTGTGHFQGKQSIQDKSWINLFTINSGTNMISQPGPSSNMKAEANFALLQENSKLQSRCEVLEYQNKQLSDQVNDLLRQIADLEENVADLEAEAAPVQLSEQQNILLEFAKPLMPGIQAMAFAYLQKFLPQGPEQVPAQIYQANDQPGT